MRGAIPLLLLTGFVLAGSAVWLTASAKAGHWVWKGWERLFGPSSLTDVRPRILAQVGGSGNYTITTIDDPSAGTSAMEGTLVFAVNASGAMTGAYSDQVGVVHGFIYANGTFTSFDALNESGLSPQSGWFQGTTGISIDTAGEVVGVYADSNNAYHGFLRLAATGAITTFDDPSAPTATSSRGTFPMGINNAGQIVGFYTTGSYDTASLYHGFLYSVAGGTYTEIDEPNAGTGEFDNSNKEGTVPVAINASGVVTGYYADSTGTNHGFIYSAGNYTSFDAPGAYATGHSGLSSGTVATSIDAAGDVIGSYIDSNLVRHGFIRSAAGTITTFDAPGANTTSLKGALGGSFGGTLPTSIDPTGSYVTGTYTDSAGLGHGFVYYLPLSGSGSFTTFTPPNMTTSTTLPIQGGVFGVNASGTVVGFYLDSSEVAHGFEYTLTQTPAPTFSPVAGNYTSAQTVTISDLASGATIYYTTNGTIPTTSSTQYTGPITVSSTETIEAIATASGYANSAVASATYTIGPAGTTPSFTTFNAPGAGSSMFSGTLGIGIDASGDVAGTYLDANLVAHGFVLPAGGTISTFDASGAGTSSSIGSGGTFVQVQGTIPVAVNSGTVVGTYVDANNCYHGFERSSTGTITEFDVPGDTTTGSCAFDLPKIGTRPIAINSSGVIAGTYLDGNAVYHGFVRGTNGTITTFDAITGTSGTYPGTGTVPLGIDTAGDVVGTYIDQNGNYHGFLRAAAGTITTFDVPNAVGGGDGPSRYEGTIPLALNDSGTIAGTYTDANMVRHGFSRSASGTTTSFDIPGAGTSNFGLGSHEGTGGFSIDPSGDIAGMYLDSNAVFHGFLRSANGTITTIDVPGAGTMTLQGTGAFSIKATGQIAGTYADSNFVFHAFVMFPPATSGTAATPTFSPAAGTYTSAQTVTISDATSGATIYYTTNGTAPTTSSAIYSAPITVSSTETIEAIAVASGYSTSAVASAAYTINIPAAATPSFSPVPGTYTSAQTVTISDGTSGATIYYTTNGTTPTTSSTVYSSPITVSSTETIEAIAVAGGYTSSAVASATYTINIPTNPAPILSSLSPAFTSSGGSAFTLTATGTGFISGSTVYWGATALSTTYASATQLTAQVPAADIAASGTTAITVQTPGPGGGTSNTLVFEVDSGSSGNGPTFTTLTATVTPGSTATYPVTLPSSASNVTVICLNLPAGASCSYSASSSAVIITTSSSTPAGTYQITVVFTETLPGAALIVLPFLLLPLAWARRRWVRHHFWSTACLGLLILAGAAGISCGGGGSSGGGGGGGGGGSQTHTVTSSGVVTLSVQ